MQKNKNAPSSEPLLAEFMDHCADKIELMDQAAEVLFEGGPKAAAALADIRREAHSLKGLGTSYGFPLMTVVAHRLEDFLNISGFPGPHMARQIVGFLDALREAASPGGRPGAVREAAILRSLPIREESEDGAAAADSALVVLPRGLQRRLIEDELRSLGLRAMGLAEGSDALEAARRLNPNLIVTGAVIEGMSGIDLCCSLRADLETRSVPIVLVTSFAPDDYRLKSLPEDISVVFKGEAFAHDLAMALIRRGF